MYGIQDVVLDTVHRRTDSVSSPCVPSGRLSPRAGSDPFTGGAALVPGVAARGAHVPPVQHGRGANYPRRAGPRLEPAQNGTESALLKHNAR